MSRRLLLCTDMDRTLLPNGSFPESSPAREHFRALADRPEIVLAYVTGRHLALVKEAIEAYELPQPHFAVTDVGTRICARAAAGWRSWADWEDQIAGDWEGSTQESLHALFRDLEGLSLQEPEKLNPCKLSYYVPQGLDHTKLLSLVKRRLRKKAVRAELLWSVDEVAQIGLLDILPASAGKLHAIEHLRAKLGFSLRETVFAGDSGNDLPVLASCIPSVLVANASPKVRGDAVRAARRAGNSEALYLARGGLFDMNGNYSAGILEGVLHFRPEFREWLARRAGAGNPSSQDQSPAALGPDSEAS